MLIFDQTTFSDAASGEHGDCCRACVATILQIELARLPHPIAIDGSWSGAFMKALREDHGVSIRSIEFGDPEIMAHPDLFDEQWGGFVIPRVVMAAGPSPRGPWHHAVVYDRFAHRMLHDPHPSRDGLSKIEALDYLGPIRGLAP